MPKQGIELHLKPRKTRSDKKINVNPALDLDTNSKLKRLAVACEITKTHLAGEIIKMALNNPDIVRYFQDKYGADEYRIITLVENGKVTYLNSK